VKHHLQEQVAELLAEIIVILALDGVGDLVGLLDRIGLDRIEILLDVPGGIRFRADGAPP
jgi:hypothetical protein